MALANVLVVSSAAALAEEAAERFVEAQSRAIGETGRFIVALSGGATPRSLYARLAMEPFRSRVDWERVTICWGDERLVPPEHPDSNYRLVHELLLSRVPVRADNVHRMRGDAPDPELAAIDYADRLRSVFSLRPGDRPRFDLILLGMGADGHTASLFPHARALQEATQLVVAAYVETLRSYRLTLTLPVLNAAAAVLFLVAGSDKAEPLRRVLTNKPSGEAPASLVRPESGALHWIVDRAAAAALADKLAL